MAQYGNNLYGASYYGINGVFAGQFVSDKTALPSPLPDAPPDIGEPLVIELYVKHTNVEYNAALTDGTFIYGGTWNALAQSRTTMDAGMAAQINLTGSNMVLSFRRRDADGAMVDIIVTEYRQSGSDIQEIQSQVYTVDTKTTDSFAIPDQSFGNYKINISMNTSSPVDSVFEFISIKAKTTDTNMELRTTMQNISANVWSNWATPSTAISTYDDETDVEHITWTTGDLTGLLGYQFKLMMASSDNTTTPEVTRLWIHSGSSQEYNKAGYWKMVIDLGADWNPAADVINTITYVADTPDSTSVEIRSRVTADATVLNTNGEELATWEYWTPPYSDSARRVILDIKTNPAAINRIEGYVISPLVDPENLTKWISYTPNLLISSVDPTGTVTNNLTSVVVDILDENLNVITADGKKQSFIYKASSNLPQAIGSIKQKARIKVTIKRNINQSSPAIDLLTMKAEADYTEIRNFGLGAEELKGFGSAVFGDNTGIDAVYTNRFSRTDLASISNFAFTMPLSDTFDGKIAITNPSYTIANINMPTYDGVRLYWASQKDNENKSGSINLTDELTDDYVMVDVKADGTKIKKHSQYGSGITIKVGDLENNNYDNCIISNAFTPPIDTSKTYAYHLSNGFPGGEPNPNADIRWNSENALIPREDGDDITDITRRRNIVCEPGQQINASIAVVTTGMMAAWKSEERIFEASVNIGSPQTPRLTRIHLDSTNDLPEIPGDVVIEANPYKVSIVDGSIVSEGEIRENDRVSLSIDNSYNTYTIASEEQAPVIKSGTSIDYLPKHRTVEIRGIYTSLSQFAPLYVEADPDDPESLGDFIIREDRCTIDWAPAITRGTTIPTEGEVMYVSYTYEKLDGIDMEATCDYNKNEYDMLNVYRTEPKYYTGRCSYGIDYVSGIYNITDLWTNIPPSVDKPSMILKAVATDNDLVSVKVLDGKVVGTLGDNDPRENWHPHIKDGFYYIGKNQYYLSTSPYVETLGDSHIPNAQNTMFAPGTLGNGLLIQESTENLFANSRLDVLDEIEEVFVDAFER